MTKEQKPKTRWGCIITVLIIVLILAGAGYLFYAYIYPQIWQKTQPSAYTPPTVNKEGQDKVKNSKDYGTPIQDNEPAGRADPFAPI